MEYKMVCIDVDGTLLNSENELTEAVKQAIYRITFEKYIPVILVSARTPQGIEFLQEELDIMRPMICYGGAMIVQDDVIYSAGMPIQAAQQALADIGDADVSTCICAGWDWYTEQMDAYVQLESSIVRSTPTITPFPALLDDLEQSSADIHKVLCMGDEDKILALEARMQSSNPHGLDICRSHPNFLEIMPAGVDKAAAIEKVAALYDYGLQDVLALGDNYNDIPMLKAAGLGLAMGNAPEEVRQAADGVAPTNDDDGVAWAIDKYFFNV